MGSYNFCGLSETMDSNLAFVRRFRKRNDHIEQASAPRLSRKRDLVLAFVIVSLPLLVISILLLAFISLPDREIPASYAEITALPYIKYPSLDAFHTNKDHGCFSLVGSWASNIAEMVVVVFMLLF